MTWSVRPRATALAVAIVAAALFSIRAAAQVDDPDPARFKAEIDAFVSDDAKNAVPADPILFVGSSSIRMWPTADRFPDLPVINRGFGGSHISDVNHYIRETVLEYAAPVVVFYAGDNDIHSNKTPRRVLDDYRAFVERVLAARPDTQIIFIAIKPSLARWDEWPRMREANALVEQYSSENPRLHFVDVAPPMLGGDRRPRPELFVRDGLHMSPLGYDIWTELVGRAIREVRAEQATRAQASASSPNVVFFDDFSGPELDRTKWNVIVTGRTVNNEQQAYVDSPETIRIVPGEAAEGAANGALAITARWRPGFETPEGNHFDFTSGRLDTRDKVQFTYGTASARLKLTAGAGLWPAFWALGAGRWPATGEIDIMENVGDPSWTNVALHGPGYSGDTPLVRRSAFLPSDDVTKWHEYAVHWTPDTLTFSVDGQVFYTVTKAMVEKYGAWAYDNPKFLILNLALGGQYPQAVNHATSPYPGLPQPTVDLIKADRVSYLVDWVRITRD